MTIRVTVTARGALAERLPDAPADVELADGTAVGGVLDALALPAVPCVFVVNGVATTRGRVLADGDRVQLHPQQAGG